MTELCPAVELIGCSDAQIGNRVVDGLGRDSRPEVIGENNGGHDGYEHPLAGDDEDDAQQHSDSNGGCKELTGAGTKEAGGGFPGH